MRVNLTKNMVSVPRPSSSLVAFWALTGVAALLTGDLVVRGDWRVLAISIAPVGLLLWASWLTLYRPRIVFDADRVVAINPLRIIEAPWKRVVTVRQRLQVLLDLDDGSTITCWGSPFPEKPGRRRPDPGSRRTGGGDVSGPLEAARSAAETSSSLDASGAVTRRWDLPVVSVGAVLTLACILELALVR